MHITRKQSIGGAGLSVTAKQTLLLLVTPRDKDFYQPWDQERTINQSIGRRPYAIPSIVSGSYLPFFSVLAVSLALMELGVALLPIFDGA